MKTPKVTPGKPQALNETTLGQPMSTDAFLGRFLLPNQELCAGVALHIAAYLVQGLQDAPAPYVNAHSHPDCDEIGLVVGPPDELEYEIILNEKVNQVISSAGIFIPAGTVHRARALRGNGAYVCILVDPHGLVSANVNKPAV